MRPKRRGLRDDILDLINSEEADQVTQLMSKIYVRLLLAPPEWWESDETMRVRRSRQEEVETTAWAELIGWLHVTPGEARAALEWMQEKQIITYCEHQSGREIEITLAGLYFPA